MAESQCCGTCRFWARTLPQGHEEPGGDIGLCRRYPPTGVLASHLHGPPHYSGSFLTHDPTRVWPRTDPREWCGEYQPEQEG